MADDHAPLERTITIDAAPGRVWELVRDVTRIPEWSPDVVSTRYRDGHDGPALGAEFTSLNRKGELEWITHGEVVRFEDRRTLAFRVAENRAIWSFDLEPDGEGTRVVQRREAPDGISERSQAWAEEHLGGGAAFTSSLESGMEQTLERLRDAVETSASPGDDTVRRSP